MSYTLTLPEVGETVTEGTIERWLKAPGDEVAKYEPIVEVNTDKVNVELPSPVTGTVLEILVAEGETVPIGADLCTIDQVAGETPAEMAEKNAASLALIDKLLAKSDISDSFREELDEYKKDIASGDFMEADRRYVAALHKRLK